MPVKTLAMNRLKGHKRNFYMDEHGGYRHEYVDFYPAELVEKIIEDLSNQVLAERKKWSELFDIFRDRRKKLRQERHGAVAALHRLQMAYAHSQYAYYAMEVELCKHDGTDPAKAMENLRRWTRIRNGLAYRDLLRQKGTPKKEKKHYAK